MELDLFLSCVIAPAPVLDHLAEAVLVWLLHHGALPSPPILPSLEGCHYVESVLKGWGGCFPISQFFPLHAFIQSFTSE